MDSLESLVTHRTRHGETARKRRKGRHANWCGPICCFASVLGASAIVGIEHCGDLIWVANGLALSYLLVAPRWRWNKYLSAAFCGMLIGGLLAYPNHWARCIWLSICNLLEVWVAAQALRKRSAQLPTFFDQRYLLRFVMYAVAGAPALVSFVFVAGSVLWKKELTWWLSINWITTDGLGTAITAPACVALFQNRLKRPSSLAKSWLLFALIPITIGAFAQSRVPILYLIYPVIALILFQFGLGWAALSTMLVSGVAGWFTIHNMGPFAAVGLALDRSAIVLLQCYIASGMFLLLVASSVMDTLRATERKLRETVNLHELVTANSRDVIIFADFAGRRSYVSPAAERLGGWTQRELLGHRSLELVHQGDRLRVGTVLERLRSGGSGELVEYRVKNAQGGFLWVEGNLRCVRDPVTGLPVGILNMLRDISRRKEAERKLTEAHATLSALAATDALTHLANRRTFDQCLRREWRRCLTERLPVSLLAIDADWFKSFNDTYGHPSGDQCLKQIAESALESVTRSGDLVARIGGEEFAVILPGTDRDGARYVAEAIRAALQNRKIPHTSNPSDHVTVSVGCATFIPVMGSHASSLVQKADDALYEAKHAGRNRVCSFHDAITEVTLRAG